MISALFSNFSRSGLRLCFSRCATSSFCQVMRARRAVSPLPIAGATERGPSGIASELGVAVASEATDSVEAWVCTAAILVSSSLGLFGLVRRHQPVGLVGLGRDVLRQLGLLDLGLLLGQRRRRHRRIGVRSRRQVGGFPAHRREFDADLDRIGAGCRPRFRLRANARSPARRSRGAARARPPRPGPTAVATVSVRFRGRTSRRRPRFRVSGCREERCRERPPAPPA